MILLEEYKDTKKYSFPDQLRTDPKEKQEAHYSKRYCQAIYNTHIRNKTSMDYGWWNDIQVLRDYGQGKQDEYYYVDQLQGENVRGTSTQKLVSALGSASPRVNRKGYKNLNTKIISIAQNLKNVVHGNFENYEEDVYVNAIDPISGEVEENSKWDAYVNAKFNAVFREAEQQAGISVPNESIFPEDVSQDELDQFKALGGFKTNWAIAMEEILDFTFEVSNWDRTLKRKYIDDMLDINFIAGRCYYDPEDMKWKVKYIDPAYFVIQYSIEKDFDDAEYGGYYELTRVTDLVNKGFKPEQLRETAKKYAEQFGNPYKSEWDVHDIPNSDGTYPWFDYRVPVLHAAWIDTDVERTLQYNTKYGKTTYIDLGWEEAPQPLSQRKIKAGYQQEVVNTNNKYTYQASWIVGTDLVYDYGKMINQPRKSKNKSQLPFKAFRNISTNSKIKFGSVIEMIIPFLDQIQLAWLRMQDTIAKSIDDGYAINLRLLNGMNIGGEKIKDYEIWQMFAETGVMPYMDVSAPGQHYRGGDVTPVKKIPGGLGTRLQEAVDLINMNIGMIEQFTGISRVALGAKPTSSETATMTKLAMQGTEAVLRPFMNGIFDLKMRLAEYTTKAIPILFRNIKGMEKVYGKIIGEQEAAFVQFIDREGIEFGLYLESRPTAEDKQDFITYITTAMQPDRSSQSQLDVSQGMKLIQMVKSGANIKQLWKVAEFMIRKEQKRQQDMAERNIMLQGQQNQQLKQQEMQGKITEKKMDVEGQMALEDKKHINTMEEKKFEADLEYRQYLRESARAEDEAETMLQTETGE